MQVGLAELRRPIGSKAPLFAEDKLKAIRNNLHPMSHAAIADWQAFPWHRFASSPKSSQAMAVSILGSIAALPTGDRDAALAAVAKAVGAPDAGPWTLLLECFDTAGALGEPTPTQVDAAAIGANSILILECKFTEPGGSCGQTRLDERGRAACNGNYALQTNFQNGIEARCALAGKRIRYWDHVPAVYGLPLDVDQTPCPFTTEAYQWMRNVVLARSLSQQTGKAVKVIAAHADAPFLHSAIKAARNEPFGLPPLNEGGKVIPLSYQRILSLAAKAAPFHDWEGLRAWLESRINSAKPKREKREKR